MEIGISTLFFPQERIEVVLRKIERLKLTCAEIVYEMPHFSFNSLDSLTFKKLGSIINLSGLKVSVHAPFMELNLGSSYPQIRSLTVRMIKKGIQLCAHLEAYPLVIHPGYSFRRERGDLFGEARERFWEGIEECAEYANKEGVCLSLENAASPSFFTYEFKDMAAMAKKIKNLGLTLDIGHAYIMEKAIGDNDPSERMAFAIKYLLKPFLNHVHIHNNFGERDDHFSLLHGEIKYLPVINALKEIDFKGKIIIEGWEPERSEKQASESIKEVKRLLSGEG